MTQGEAHGLLLSFLQRAHAGGLRYVLVITGKGASFGSEGVLKRAVPAWLSTPPFRALVSSHDSAARQHGGAGAHLCEAAPAQRAAPAMTPFGERLRQLRRAKGVSQKQMAASLGVSAAYLSALGARPARPAELGDAAEDHRLFQRDLGRCRGIAAPRAELRSACRHRHGRAVAGATALANLLARRISSLDDGEIEALASLLDRPARRVQNSACSSGSFSFTSQP